MDQKHITYYFSSHDEKPKMHGVKRVLIFCMLIVILPSSLIITPLYLRQVVFANVTYKVAESDVIEIRDGMSSIFCQQHSLSMSSKFSAFQLSGKPKMSRYPKHIRLKKSMTLPDDTFEYWGFYLLKGAKVHLKFCSRYDGSRILVVRGQRILDKCGLLDHNKNKLGAGYAEGHEQVKVFFEDMTEITEHLPDEVKKESGGDVKNQYNLTDDQHMEEENHGGEHFDNDDDALVTKLPKLFNNADIVMESTTTTTSTSTPKPLKKKLKKGSYSRKPKTSTQSSISSTVTNYDNAEMPKTRRKRSAKTKLLYDELYKPRKKREQVLDRKFSHGGNAANFTETDESNSVSSFETSLFDCYKGHILLAEGFPPTPACLSAHSLENGSQSMLTTHEVNEDGYYYYIFYSDNDLVRNDIHAIFDLYQVTFQYSNLTGSQKCVNVTECTFPVSFLSKENVVVEVPTRDGIEHEDDDTTHLISTCHPRTQIYAIFPILVLVLILSCSFL